MGVCYGPTWSSHNLSPTLYGFGLLVMEASIVPQNPVHSTVHQFQTKEPNASIDADQHPC